MSSLVKPLLRRYRELFDESPAWAWPIRPSIPLVGERYRPGAGLLIYASAENLNWMNREAPPRRFTGASAWNRYRGRYDEAGRHSDDFFPDVGIQPVSDGGLLTAGLFIAERLYLPRHRQPRQFLERIAVSNWCEFSVRTPGRNRDHINDVKKLTPSLPFVVSELAELRPAAVLIPKVVWRHPLLRAAMRGASPATRFIPAPQFNATVVNCHLSRYDSRRGHRVQTSGFRDWIAALKGVAPAARWRYFAALSELLEASARDGRA